MLFIIIEDIKIIFNANGLPNVNVVFIILKIFAKILGAAYGNKRLTHLLFENLQKRRKSIKTDILLYCDKNKQNIKNSNNFLKISKTNIISA